MPLGSLRPARVRVRTLGFAALALALCAAMLFAAAAPASAITRKEAAKRALAALGSSKGSDPVIVFGLTKPLRAGTRVTQAGSKGTVATVGHRGAFFFYEDSGPFQAYRHPGRVALVAAKSGKVKVSNTITGAPLVGGRLPAFLRSSKSYGLSKYRVFSRLSTGAGSANGPLFENDPFGGGSGSPSRLAAQNNSQPRADQQSVNVKQNVAKNITLTGSDGDGDLLTFEITKQPDHGTLSGQAPDVTYTPDPGYLGSDDFHFKTNDGEAQGLSNAAKVSITVVPRGVPSTVTTSAGCTAYTERAPAVVVDGSLMVLDPDDLTLNSARVRISANLQGGDVLLFTDQNGIAGSYDDNTGVLDLTGTSSVANYQAALRSVRYRNVSSGNPSATKDVQFTANDGGGDSAPATKQICITGGAGGNNAPTGETSEGGLSYTENDGPVPVDAGFVVGDPDSANLSGATIKFIPVVSQPVDENGDPVGPPVTTVTYAPAEDSLAFADQNGITGSFDSETGVMTLSGTASLANYETAIRSVTYENSSENPSDAQRRMQFQVTDSSGANSTPSRRDIFVTPVNDAPVVTTTEGSASYTGADPPVAIDSGLTAGDVDDTNLEGAQVKISDGFASGDLLGFVDQNGISGTYDGDTGVLSLSGTASVADYQAALRSVEYSHTGGNPSGSRTVEFTVNDGDLDSGPATKDIQLNDKPVLDPAPTALSYNEGDGPVAVDSGITATDADSATLAGATVQITGNFSSAQDTLSFTDLENGITGSYDGDTGTLTLTGTASVADYQATLRGVTYENSSNDPSTVTRTVTFQADDGATSNNLSDPVTRDVEVTAVNDAPFLGATEAALSYTEGDGAVAVDSGITANDPDSANLAGATVQITGSYSAAEDALAFAPQNGITGAYDGDTGTLTLSGTASVADYETALRSVTYENSSNDPSTVTRTVTFQADDGAASNNLSDPVTRNVEVTAVNDAPVVTTSAGSTSYTEGDTAGVEVDNALTVADVDDANMEGGQVRISSGFEAGDDLVFADTPDISGSYNAVTGVLTLTGTASVGDYETALRSIKYRHTGASPSPSKTVEFTVNDGDADSNAATKSIDVVPPPNL